MKKEYRYNSNILLKLIPLFWFCLVLSGFVYSMILFIPQRAYSYILVDVVIIGFFIYVFYHIFQLYFLHVPLLIVDEQSITVRTLYGVKNISYEDIVDINIKRKTAIGSTVITIESKTNSPIKIAINQLDDTQENIEKYIVGIYNSFQLQNKKNEDE